MSSERLPAPDARLQLPHTSISDLPGTYTAFAVANYYGEVISMLRLRYRDDTWRAFSYFSLTAMSYDPILGIELVFSSTLIRLRGRNLFQLFTLLGDHSVRWVWEADRAACLQTPESQPLIDRIELGASKSWE